MQNYETEQEKFWAGEFGNDYIKRNEDGKILAAKTAFFAKIISCLHGGDVRSCIEFGSNIGLNLMALRHLMPELQLSAVEINEQAAAQCAKIPGTHVYNNSLFDFTSDEVFDLTFVSGVLIHINPEWIRSGCPLRWPGCCGRRWHDLHLAGHPDGAGAPNRCRQRQLLNYRYNLIG